jgi:hypothetical protein
MSEDPKHKAAIPNPLLEPFNMLIGEWNTVATHAYIPGTTFHGHTSFEWFEGGAFVVMHTELEPAGIPNAIAVIGSDDFKGELYMLYFDERGVSRRYALKMDENDWTFWRISPGFFQRFTGSLLENGSTIIGKSDLSKDDGRTWERDFEITYERAG